MAFEDDLRRSIETLTDRVRQEVVRQLSTITDELSAAAAADRRAAVFDASASARAAAEEAAESRLAEALAAAAEAERAAEARGHDAGHRLGLEQGRQEGFENGRKEGLEAGRKEGMEAGRDEGRDAGYKLGRDAGLAEGRAEGENAARLEFQASASAAADRVLDAFRALDRARSLTEILDTLGSCAAREAARVAILIVEGETLRGWRFLGFAMAPDEERGVAILADGFLAGVISSGAAATHTSSSAVAPSFARLPADRPFVVVPVRLAGDTVAVLYADQEMSAERAETPRGAMHVNGPWPAVIEALVRHAARCLEAVTATRAAHVLRRPASSGSPTNPGPSLAEARR